MQISISYSYAPYGIHLRTSLPTGEPTYLTPTNPSNTPIQTTNQILPEIQPVVSATHLMIRLGGNPKQKYSRGNTYPVAAEQEDYPGTGEPIGEVKEYKEECRDVCENPWAPFASAQGFKLASSFIESKVSKTRINDYFLNGIGNSTSIGYSSMHMLENLLRHLDPYSPYLQWLEGHVEHSQRTLPFFYRNAPDCARHLPRQIAYHDDLVYAPRREYDQSGHRI